jgi:predicted DNA-binding transcriptional regulator AlpA
MSTKRFLSKREVRDKVKLSYAEIARREKALKFPSRLRLGVHRNSRSVWIEAEIDQWMDDQIARRRIDAS